MRRINDVHHIFTIITNIILLMYIHLRIMIINPTI